MISYKIFNRELVFTSGLEKFTCHKKFDTKSHLSSSNASTKQVRDQPVTYRMTYVSNHKSISSLYDSFPHNDLVYG